MKDRIWLWIARHLPKKLLMWCYVSIMANASAKYPNTNVGNLTYDDVWKAEFKEIK